MVKDNVTLYSNCYTYHLLPLKLKFRAMRDDEGVSFKELQQTILEATYKAQNTPARKRFIKKVLDKHTKLQLCQLVENACDCGANTQMIHYTR